MAIELHHLNTHGMMESACDVLDGVAKLKARIAELEEERRWRKFPDEKPEEWDTVIVRFGDGFYDLAVYMSNGQGWDIGDGRYHKSEEVSHWMPLPSAPKEEE
jgi:hypothetical protein